MGTIAVNLQAVYDRIQRAARACERDPFDIFLLAVSKSCPAHYIEAARAAGQIAFGESYAQEGVRKITQLAPLGCEWHFIGPIQSNKTRVIAEHFHWVHSVDREKVAARLNDGASAASRSAASLHTGECQRRSDQKRRCGRGGARPRAGDSGHAAVAFAWAHGDTRAHPRRRHSARALQIGSQNQGPLERGGLRARYVVHGHVGRSRSGDCGGSDDGQSRDGDLWRP